MAQRVTNKVAVATGGDGGMGAATACRVWKEGARVGVVVKPRGCSRRYERLRF